MQVKQHQEEAAASAGTALKSKFDQCSTKSEECPSESSSSFFKLMKSKRESMNANAAAASALAANRGPNKTKKTATQHSSSLLACDNKIIPNKLKSGGIKLPLPLKMADKQDDLLEDLKRAQLARLEDQRGTEINFELPEFLKYNDNLNKSNTSGEKQTAEEEHEQKETPTFVERPPQPAPRHSISNKSKLLGSNTSPVKNDINSAIDRTSENNTTPSKGPPPLPPKPKVLPIKPSNWGVNILQLREMSPTTPPPPLSPSSSSSLLPTPTIASPQLTNVNVVAVPASSSNSSPNGRCAYLDQPSSSFV
uniref:Uncharacterized protein n=1 Tax=Musca domestica TaxID=7370 RepID=T1PJ99_MUSDO